MDAVRTLKANLKLRDKPCGWCDVGLELGEDAAICTACEVEHHRRCWEERAGCSGSGCENAPLRRLDSAAAGAAAATPRSEIGPGIMFCPGCQGLLSVGDRFCKSCKAVNSPDGLYHGAKANAPGAVAALVCGIVGLFFCGVLLGPLAISKANAARTAMAEDPTLGGEGLATAGKVLGIIDIIVFVLLVVARVGGNP